MEQMIKVYEEYEKPIISMQKVDKQDVIHYGIMTGSWDNKEQTILKLGSIVEKPTVDYAEDYLSVATIKDIINGTNIFINSLICAIVSLHKFIVLEKVVIINITTKI